MSIGLHFSNRLELLAERLAELSFETIRRDADILSPVRILVPNPHLTRWLQLTLAENSGVVMNGRFDYLEAGLWEMLAAVDPRSPAPRRADRRDQQLVLLSVLRSLSPDEPEYAPLRRYLDAGGDSDPRDRALKLWQLSARLAHLFEAYAYHRADMLHRWTRTEEISDAVERCQRRLYLQAARRRKVPASEGGPRRLTLSEYADKVPASEGGPRRLTLTEYADEVLGRSHSSLGSVPRPPVVHLFGFSQISPFHLELLDRLRDRWNWHIYALNPSQEFWEDYRTPHEKRRVRHPPGPQPPGKTATETEPSGDHPLLSAWGRPGREAIGSLCLLTDYDFETLYAASGRSDTVLGRLQDDLQTLGRPGPEKRKLPPDRSVQVAACPGIFREVESVRHNIVHNLRRDATLRLTDIVVLVPDIAAYKPVIDAVFDRHPAAFSYCMVDTGADIESLWARAVLALLDLAAGRFTRREVFELFGNPCFLQRRELTAGDVRQWIEWAAALNIFHSFDRREKKRRGYPPTGLYTWKQGLQRLRLARVMANPEKDGAPVRFGPLMPFSDAVGFETERIEKFSLTLEAVHRAARSLAAGPRRAAEWKVDFLEICDRLLAVPADRRGEAGVRRALIEAFETLERQDHPKAEPGEADLNLPLVTEFVRSSLQSISGSRGNYLTGGVTVSALQPMRPIPFRIVYVLGMQEGGFPGRANRSALDLRIRFRRSGDVSAPERNRYLFLEMLLSVRERLYISYLARDLQKDRVMQPCSVVLQLQSYIESQILTPGSNLPVVPVPLKGSSRRYLQAPQTSPAADWMVNDSPADRLAASRAAGQRWAESERSDRRGPEIFARLKPDLSMPAGNDQSGESVVERVSARELRNFLLDPVASFLKRHLGLHDPETEPEILAAEEDEHFFSRFPIDYQLLLNTLEEWLSICAADPPAPPDPRATARLLRNHYADCLSRGQTPEGHFACLDGMVLRSVVETAAGVLAPLAAAMAGAREGPLDLEIGRPAAGREVRARRPEMRRFPPLTIDLPAPAGGAEGAGSVSLHARLPWVWRDESGWNALVLTGARSRHRRFDKYPLEPLLAYFCVLAGEQTRKWWGTRPLTLHLVYGDRCRALTYRVTDDAAREYLQRLTAELLHPAVPPWLPFETVTAASDFPASFPAPDPDDRQRRNLAEALTEALEACPDYLVRRSSSRVPADALDRARRRFELLLSPKDPPGRAAPGEVR